MIKQYRLTLKARNNRQIPQFWAYRLYAWLLNQASDKVSKQIHDDEYKNISIYLSNNVWTVNLLCQEVIDAFDAVLNNTKTIVLHADTLTVLETKCICIENAEYFIEQGRSIKSSRHNITFISPSSFKQNGRYTILPKEELIIQNLVTSWNDLFPEYYFCDPDALEMLKNGIRVVNYSIEPKRYQLKDKSIPGFQGKITIDAKLPIVLHEIFNSLLCLAEFTGIGIKTRLGMGGIVISK